MHLLTCPPLIRIMNEYVHSPREDVVVGSIVGEQELVAVVRSRQRLLGRRRRPVSCALTVLVEVPVTDDDAC